MKLSNVYPSQTLQKIQDLYEVSFPSAEKKPFPVLLQKQNDGMVDILAIESDMGEFSGLAIVAREQDLALLDYFAISTEMQGQGIGSLALQLLKKRYADLRFFLEIESTLIPSKNQDDRKRRKQFYIRNGMTPLPFQAILAGVEMEVLANNCMLNTTEYLELYQNVFGFAANRNVQIILP